MRCRCRAGAPGLLTVPDAGAPAAHEPAVEARPTMARRGRAIVAGAVLAGEQAADAASVGQLPADVVALVREHAGRAGLVPAEWLARAARAYAQEPASGAERMRAVRERRRMAQAATKPVTSEGAE